MYTLKNSWLYSSSAAVKSAPDDPKAVEVASDIDKINRGLEQCEKQILGRVRMPLNTRSPTQDLEKRLQEHEVSKSCILPLVLILNPRRSILKAPKRVGGFCRSS